MTTDFSCELKCAACGADTFDRGHHGFTVCRGCGLGQLLPAELERRVARVASERHYEVDGRFAPYSESERAHKISVFHKILIGYNAYKGLGDVAAGPPGACFEVGFGNGYMMESAKMMRWDAFGCDMSASGVRDAQQRNLNVFPAAFDEGFAVHDRMEWGDFCTPLASFDIVWAWDSFEHIPGLKAAFRNAAALLKKGGLLVVHSPNLMSYAYDATHPHWMDGSHLWHMTGRAAQLMMEAEGLEVLKTEAGSVWNDRAFAHPDNFVIWGRKK